MSEIILKNRTTPTTPVAGKVKVFVDSSRMQLASVDENGSISYYGANINDPCVVTVAKSGGEFTTIGAALASITDSSETKRYIVKVGPGIFEEGYLEVPDYVSVVGDEIAATVIKHDGGTYNLFDLGSCSGVSFVLLQDVPSGYAAITTSKETVYIIAHKITMYNCDIGISLNSSSYPILAYFEYIDMNEVYTNAVKVVSGNGNEAFCNLENYYTYPTGTTNSAEVHVEGADARVEILAAGITGNTYNTGVYITDGASAQIGATVFKDCNIAVHSDLTGTGSDIKITGTSFLDCTTNIKIENTATTGHFTGYSEFGKTEIDTDSAFFITNKDHKMITVSKKGGDFSSIKDALAVITDASETNPYLVLVGPGLFEEEELVVPAYVNIEGSTINTTIVKAKTATQNIFKLNAATSEVSFLNVIGAGTGYAGFLIEDPGNFVQLHKISIYECDYGVKFYSTTQDSYVYLEYVDINGPYTNAIKVYSQNGYVADLNTENFYLYPDTSTTPQIDISGVDCKLNITTAGIQGINSSDKVINVKDGAYLSISATYIENADTGIYIENSGSGPQIDLNCSLECTTYDLYIDHAGCTGRFIGSANIDKVYVDEAAVISMSYADHGEVGQVVLKDIYQGSRHDRLINLSKLTRETATLGRVSGGELSVNSGRDLDVTAGTGFLKDITNDFIKEITWDADTITIPANTDSYIFVDTNLDIQTSESPQSIENVVLLGRAKAGTSAIEFLNALPVDIPQYGNKTEDMLRDAFGPVYSSGSIISENGSYARNLDITSGTYYLGTYKFSPSGGTRVYFDTAYRDGSGGWTYTTAQQTVDNSNYDDGSGTLAALTTSYYAKHAFYVAGEGSTEKYGFLYAQAQYATLTEAQEADIPNQPPWIKDGVCLIATIIVKQGQSSIVETRDERPRLGFKPSAVSAVTDHGDLTGLLDDDHTQYLKVDGTRAMTGALNMGSQNITSVGTVDGVTVSAHQSRHLPNGSDALTTAAPSSNLTASTTNSVGSANSLSRSDHSHAITTGAASTQTPDQSNAAGSSANLARADHIHNIPAAAPSSIGTANTKGTAASFALSDHIHNHGSQTEGTHHAVATQSVAGFLSSTDKTKLDNMTALITSTTQANTTNDYASITQLTTSSLATGTYMFKAILVAQSSTTVNGLGFRLGAGSATVGVCYAKWFLAYGANGYDQSYIYDQTSPTQNSVSPLYPSSNTNQISTGEGIFTVTGAGTVAVQFRSENTGSTITVQANSLLYLWKIA